MSYKIDLDALTREQLNRIIHHLEVVLMQCRQRTIP